MSDTTETTDLAKIEAEFDTRIASSVATLSELAESLDDELGSKVLDLARLTQPGIKGMEGEQRVRIPTVRVRQPSSTSDVIPEDCKNGQLFDSQGNTLGDSLSFIPILLHEMRQKWGEDQMDCQSLDGVTGTRYGDCQACPYGRFVQGARPDCSNGYSYFVVTEDLTALYRISFMKSSAKAGKNIKRLIQPPALWGRSFSVSTEKISANSRNYYELRTAATGRRTDEETMKVCDALHTYYQANYHQALHFQSLFAKRLKEGSNGANATGENIEISDDSEVLDFSENM